MIRSRLRVCAAVFAGLIFWPQAAAFATATDDEAEAAYEEAIALLDRGQRQRAAEAFADIADRWPESPRAASALYAAARLYEEKLGDLPRAASLYDRLATDYPRSRLALSASRRLAGLERATGESRQGATATAAYSALLAGAGKLSPADAIARAQALIQAHPDWPGAPHALLFIAASQRRAGNLHAALATYLRATRDYPAGDHLFEAYGGAGLCALELSRFDRAEGHYRQMLAVAGDPGRREAAQAALARVDRARLLANLSGASMIVAVIATALLSGLLVIAAGSGRAALATVCRPPTEAIFLAPLAALFVAASYLGARPIAGTVTAIVAAGLVATWLSGATLAAADRRRSNRRALALACAGLAALLVIATSFAAAHEARLVRALENTIDFGPDRA